MLQDSLKIQKILITKEDHKEGGYHYHVFFIHEGWSNRKFTLYLRNLFSMVEGYGLNIKYTKGALMNTLGYILKSDLQNFSCIVYSYNFSNKEVGNKEVGEIINSYKKRYLKTTDYIFDILKSKNSWDEVLDDSELKPFILTRYSTLRKLFKDLQSKKLKELRISSDVVLFKQNPVSYFNDISQNMDFSKFGEYLTQFKSFHIDIICWLYQNLMFLRNERDLQLLVVSSSTTGKSKFIKQLLFSLNLKFYTTDSEDFTGYKDKLYDLVFIDEFNIIKDFLNLFYLNYYQVPMI